jgi:hypothetical protein
MKIYVHLRKYLAEFLLEWEIIQTEVVQNKTFYIQSLIGEYRPRLWDNFEKFGKAR